MSVFDTLREQISLDRVVQVNGSGKARCVAPDHQDNDPSMHVYTDHVHCFACSFHGDVTDVWAAMRGFDRPIDAALDLAREFRIQLPEISPEARQKAHKRREKEDLYLRQARACQRALESHPHVREWWERRGFGPELRERFLLGTSKDGTAAVIPFWHRGRVQGLIRRKLEGEPKYLYPKAEEFTGGYRPLFIPGSVRAGVLLVEGIVDALSLAALGEGAIAVGGTGLSREQMRELENFAGPLYILFDADEDGEQAARKLVREFYPKALVCAPEYGEGLKDVADLYQTQGEGTRAALEGLRADAVDALDLALSEASEGSARKRHRYAKEQVLPLLLKLKDAGERGAALRDVARGLKLAVGDLRETLSELEAGTKAIEQEQPAAFEVDPERALDILGCEDLLERAADDMNRLGHVGERHNKKLALICAVSARAGTPIQPSTHAQSSAGKNALWDSGLSLVPPEMVIRRSGLSAKALFRTQTNLKGAVLYLQEVAGSEEANYTIRVMQSDGRLEYEATEKMPDGSLRNVVHQVEGPAVIVQTTTKNHLHNENETRVFPIYIDESEEQTDRITDQVKLEATGKGIAADGRKRITEAWHDAIRLLEPAEVVIPYAQRIEVPSSPIRIRRDVRRLIDVVRVIAWLHQHQRERDAEGRILATEEDFDEALGLVSESLRRAWQTLTPTEETVLRTIRKLSEQLRSKGFRRRDLKVKEASDRTIKLALKSLTDTGYLDCDGRAGPQGYTYTLAREAEKISLGISLRPLPDSQENPANDENTNGQEPFARYRPVPDSEEGGRGHREAGNSGQNDNCPIENGDLQDKSATGQAGGEKREEKTSTSGQRLSAEEVQEVERLVREGMAPRFARAAVLQASSAAPDQRGELPGDEDLMAEYDRYMTGPVHNTENAEVFGPEGESSQ